MAWGVTAERLSESIREPVGPADSDAGEGQWFFPGLLREAHWKRGRRIDRCINGGMEARGLPVPELQEMLPGAIRGLQVGPNGGCKAVCGTQRRMHMP